MGLQCLLCCTVRLALTAVLLIVCGLGASYYYLNCGGTKPTLASNGYWGTGDGSNHKDDEKIYKFKISVSDKTLQDLNSRLDRARYSRPLEDAKFTYGFNGATLKKLADYWRNKYNWRKEEAELNKFDHYKTQIEGIDIHFMHARNKNLPKTTKVVPILIVHGWPGSVIEFVKLLPLLTAKSDDNIAFEVICPSIPGYGFSEASHKKGLNAAETGRIFMKLMKRLGHEKFYVQGGDFGAIVVTSLTRFYPDNVLGLHLNFPFVHALSWRNILFKLFPSIFDDADRPPRKMKAFDMSPLVMLEESGYFHIQATKPDTVGAGLDDSPVALAAYVGEKFSSAMNPANKLKEDGGLFDPDMKIPLDHILTNIMVYWVTETGNSAVRFYKEYISIWDHSKWPLSSQVPVGIISFPNEISTPPRFAAKQQYPNITTFTYMKQGGHFAAMEEPEALAGDIRNFVRTVESLYPRSVPQPKPFQHSQRTHDEL